MKTDDLCTRAIVYLLVVLYTIEYTEGGQLELYAIHPNAFKHGLTEDEICHAWRNGFSWARRNRDDGKVEYVLIGIDSRGRLVELIARTSVYGYIVFHALTPPTERVLRELGLID